MSVSKAAPRPVTRSTRAVQEPVEPKWGIDPDTLLSYQQVAKFCGIPDTKAKDWIYRYPYRLPFIQLPRGRRVVGADLIRFLEAGYVKAGE